MITQSALQRFQDEMGKAMKDPYKVQLDSVTHILQPPPSLYDVRP